MARWLDDPMAESQAAQPRNLLPLHTFRHYQHVKTLAHAGGRDEMLELQRNLRALLRRSGVAERVGKLVRFADAEQELRLRQQRLRLHAGGAAEFGGGGEVDVRGNVLLARRLVR